MAICPDCGANIAHLFRFTKWEQKLNFVSKAEEYEVAMYHIRYEDDDYECPKCHHVITNDMDDAEAFLKRKEEC